MRHPHNDFTSEKRHLRKRAQIKKLPRGPPLAHFKTNVHRIRRERGRGKGAPGVTSLFEPPISTRRYRPKTPHCRLVCPILQPPDFLDITQSVNPQYSAIASPSFSLRTRTQVSRSIKSIKITHRITDPFMQGPKQHRQQRKRARVMCNYYGRKRFSIGKARMMDGYVTDPLLL